MILPKFAHARTEFRGEEGEFLLFLEAESPERCGTVSWFVEHREKLLEALDHFGVVYFRGFGADSHLFEAFADVVAPGTVPYMGQVSPRQFVHGTVYTSNDAPGPLPIVQHHELSYHGCTPRYVCFYCDQPAETGGATPTADSRLYGRTMDGLFPRVMDELEEKGVIFIRNFTTANFKTWEVAWQTSDRAELERRLRATNTEFEWLAGDWLRTKQRRSAIVRDPISGQRVLFASLNIWQRGFVEKINDVYNLQRPEDDVMLQPFATVFADGSRIPNEFVLQMDRIYNEQKVVIDYREKDFMFINNFIATHGKTPWSGPLRRIYVTLREPVHYTELKNLPDRRRAARSGA
jgi:hypothetical protein